MTGKICLITGATNGIGKETARGIAEKGATVVIVGRDAGRCETTVTDVRATTGNDNVHSMLCDLSSQADIRRFAVAFLAKYERLDVLINNAGAINSERKLTVDGLELTFAVNHLGYLLLTHLLLDLLQKSTPARIVNVASNAHRRGKLDFEDLQNERRYSGADVYSQSKLANLLFTFELSRRLEGTGVTVNALHPGVIATEFGRNTTGPLRYLIALARPFMRGPVKGAKTSIYLAHSPEVAGTSGRYFAESKEVKPSSAARDHTAQRRLWQASMELLSL